MSCLSWIKVAERSENRSARRVKALKEPVAESQGRLGVIDSGKKWRAANVAERSVGNDMWEEMVREYFTPALR